MNVSRETISISAFLSRFENILEEEGLWKADALCGPLSFLCLVLLSKFRVHKNIIVTCPSQMISEELYRHCFNLQSDGVLWFPENQRDMEDVVGFNLEQERFQSESYNHVTSEKPFLLFSTEKGLAVDVRPPGLSLISGFRITPGSSLSKDRLIEALVLWGYEPQDKVKFPKTFSSRGGILDVFLLYSSYPVRLEFFGNTIESIRTFSPMSQRRVEALPMIEILPPPSETDTDVSVPFSSLLTQTLAFELKEEESGQFVLCSQDVNTYDPIVNFNYNISLHGEYGELVPAFPTARVFAFADEQNQRLRYLEKIDFDGVFVKGVVGNGFFSNELNFACISVPEILRQITATKYRWTLDSYTYSPQESVSTIDDISWGDYLVHQDFGIGRYRGLESLSRGETAQECIKIEYADDGVVYVPVDKFNKVHKLIASGKKEPVLSSLGSKRWSQQKERVKKSTQVVVQDLVNMYAGRSQPRGFVYGKNDELYEAVEESFPYEETPDQAQAIQDVIQDMERDQPADRLICGDVGFGKTEVALRATIKAVVSGKKVLLLSPTTILADQHFISFSSRLEPVGVRIELLSRFKTKSEQLHIIEKMMRGTVDIVIGTHRLLSDDIRFPGLGLLIVDEEHRFGVKHKEKLKQLKQAVDVFTLTATPIPRTLQQSLVGIRDISKIMTPPKARKPIHTYIKFLDWSFIERVLRAELTRGGQVYFLHNDIESMPFYYNELTRRFPKASVAIAHGQMKSKDLEKIVLSFFGGGVDILLCTTIIESGLDVSNANTLIINQAHRFGLSQLYQIRGRVGRSYRQAYCYLMLPKDISLGENAFQRLKAIEQYTSLGSGLDIAMKDLEIRGAGNLFGYKQSGNIASVGFELYCQILKEAVDETFMADSKPVVPAKIVTREATLLDAEYVPHVHDRLFFYKRLSEAGALKVVDDIQDELQDRFGPLPKEAFALVQIAGLRVLFTGTSVFQVDVDSRLRLKLKEAAPFDSFESLFQSISKEFAFVNCPFRIKPNPQKDTIDITIDTGNFTTSINVATSLGRLFSAHKM